MHCTPQRSCENFSHSMKKLQMNFRKTPTHTKSAYHNNLRMLLTRWTTQNLSKVKSLQGTYIRHVRVATYCIDCVLLFSIFAISSFMVSHILAQQIKQHQNVVQYNTYWNGLMQLLHCKVRLRFTIRLFNSRVTAAPQEMNLCGDDPPKYCYFFI